MKKTFTLSFFAILFATVTSQKAAAQITDLQAIKNLYVSSGLVLPSATLSGVVISDSSSLSSGKGNSIVESGGKGIIFRYPAKTPYTLGDSVNVDITGDSLVLYNGALEIIKHSNNLSAPVATGVYVEPKVTTLTDITNNLDSLGYVLVKIINATATPGVSGGSAGTSPGATFSGSKTLTDSAGITMILYTPSKSTFAKTTMPTTPQVWTGYAANYNGTPEFTLRNINDFVTLSLVFKTFTAEAKGTNSILTWNTASEVNTSNFVIEKSFDGVSYSTLSSVSALGKASNAYTFTDATNKLNTTVYYRLKSLDKDGKFSYSTVVKVQFATSLKLTLAPNPTTLTTKLSYEASATDAVARIIAANGTLLKQVTLPAGSTATNINVSSLAKGVYYVAIAKNGTTSTLSFVKQ